MPAPSGDTTGVADTAAFRAALVALGAAISGSAGAYVATGGSGIVGLRAGSYYFTNNAPKIRSAAIGIVGPGKAACTIFAVAGGGQVATLNLTSDTWVLGTTRAPVRGFTVDGTNADNGARGITIGDGNMAFLDDVKVQNFQGPTSTIGAVVTKTDIVTNGTNTVTSATGFTNVVAGQYVIGPNIAPGVKVVSVSGNNCVLTSPATGSASGLTVWFGVSVGWDFCNQYGEMERARVRVDSEHNDIGYAFSATGTGDKSFDYGYWQLGIVSDTNALGVVFTETSNMIGGSFTLTGNYGTSGGSNTGWGIALTGGVACLQYADIHVAVECDGSGTGPGSIYIGPGTAFVGTGTLRFIAAPAAWSASNMTQTILGNHQFGFAGFCQVSGDTYLGGDGASQAGVMTTIGSYIDQSGNAFQGYFDLSTGNVLSVQLTNGANAVTVTGQPVHKAGRWVLIVKQPSSGGAGTLSGIPWTWLGGTPQLQTKNNAVDVIYLITADGTTFYGFLAPMAKQTERVLALAANSATPAINTDAYDIVHITAQTAAITSFTSGLTGSPVDGDKLRVSITGTASVAITWGTSFESSTVALPTTTSGTTRLDIGLLYSSETSKWRCVAVA
jgi:hypothetical protein